MSMPHSLNTLFRGDGCASWVATTERTNIPIVYLLINTMPTASTAKRSTTPRKRRTRKVSTTAVKSATLNTPVVKKTVTKEEPVKSIRPAKPNLTWEDYRADAIVRWNIHSYEVNELGKDLVKGYQLVKQHVVQVVNYTKESYNRAFN